MAMRAIGPEVTMTVLGKGVYTISEAARLTKLRAARASEWFRGRQAPSRIVRPVFDSDYPTVNDEYAISFLDLIELNIAGKLREAHITLPYLRKSYKYLKEKFGDHPFCQRQIFIDGKTIFTQGLNEEESAHFLQAITDQWYMSTIKKPFLEKIEYDPITKQASRWNIADQIVVDPKYRFGKPFVAGTGLSTSVLFHSYYANGEDAEAVAKWFGVERRHVIAAVDFENDLAS
jgi:uncharacterized protein (DUF433 family)